jgi:DNA polymerase epsilon subunit 1
VDEWLMKRFEGLIIRVEREKKWDLNLVSFHVPGES